MSDTLAEIAEKIKNNKGIIKSRERKEYDIKNTLIYAFNGTGKTRLSKEFQNLICGNSSSTDETEEKNKNVSFYIIVHIRKIYSTGKIFLRVMKNQN